jgi:hypothetical protein
MTFTRFASYIKCDFLRCTNTYYCSLFFISGNKADLYVLCLSAHRTLTFVVPLSWSRYSLDGLEPQIWHLCLFMIPNILNIAASENSIQKICWCTCGNSWITGWMNAELQMERLSKYDNTCKIERAILERCHITWVVAALMSPDAIAF